MAAQVLKVDPDAKMGQTQRRPSVFDVARSTSGVANSFMLAIVTNRQMRDAVIATNKEARMTSLTYAAICLQKFLRRYLQRIKAKANNTWNDSFAVLARVSST
jgi:hypothetical protein